MSCFQIGLLALGMAAGGGGLAAWGESSALLVGHVDGPRSRGAVETEMLVETGWVAAHRDDAGVRVVDMRSASAYREGHVPGAVYLEEGPLRNPDDRLTYLPAAEAFAGMMERAGISNETHVVAYDDQGGKMAARLWYVLAAFGHKKVSLVNGGWNQWVAEGRQTSTEVPGVAAARFVPKVTPALSCPSTELLKRRPGVVVLDARSPAEFSGSQVSPGASQAGRVPGAVNVEWKENVTGPTMKFKPAAELRQLYASRGITPEKEIVAHCASGGRAAQTLFTLKLLGYPNVRIYYGSFSDYTSRPDARVEK
jgi:thiosulfate/3-mercaptopyruvate sulfurtransferase